MIKIKHNFDETKFKWLWARYVKAGNIEKHCVKSIPGVYSKKFSGASNHNLLSQPILIMDEVEEGTYEAIYFCGVLKAGYLNKNPLKNNYPHNVHFIVKPQKGSKDVWNFENWHVEIEGGLLERIPNTFELKERFFKEPYTSHYYTCRIFRWMIGHFYPSELVDIKHGYPKVLEDKGVNYDTITVIKELIDAGYKFAQNCYELKNTNEQKSFFSEYKKNHKEECQRFSTLQKLRDYMAKENLINRMSLTENITKQWLDSSDRLDLTKYESLNNGAMTGDDMVRYTQLGFEEYLDMLDQNQYRKIISGWSNE